MPEASAASGLRSGLTPGRDKRLIAHRHLDDFVVNLGDIHANLHACLIRLRVEEAYVVGQALQEQFTLVRLLQVDQDLGHGASTPHLGCQQWRPPVAIGSRRIHSGAVGP